MQCKGEALATHFDKGSTRPEMAQHDQRAALNGREQIANHRDSLSQITYVLENNTSSDEENQLIHCNGEGGNTSGVEDCTANDPLESSKSSLPSEKTGSADQVKTPQKEQTEDAQGSVFYSSKGVLLRFKTGSYNKFEALAAEESSLLSRISAKIASESPSFELMESLRYNILSLENENDLLSFLRAKASS